MSSVYFERYAYPERFIQPVMLANTFLCVVIPVYKELDILKTLNSLYKPKQPKQLVEIIFVVNHPEDAKDIVKSCSKHTVSQINEFIKQQNADWITCHIIESFDLPKKKAGVGLARKIGMDEAAYRFNQIGTDGVIVCFDADSTVDENYFCAIEHSFLEQPNHMGAAIHYEHPLYNENGEPNWPIIHYELHLRYYVQALAYSGYPYAFHTIGSSMAVRSSMYQKSGGMNTRKAGEDFYFLHKIIPLGGFINITNTVITPSARESDRVPFGTGKAILLHNKEDKLLGYTYDFSIFKELKSFFDHVTSGFNLSLIPSKILAFLNDSQLLDELQIIFKNAKDEQHFQERFYQWFNGFKVLKCVHYLKEKAYPDVPVELAVFRLFSEDSRLLTKRPTTDDGLAQLLSLRNFERELDNRT